MPVSDSPPLTCLSVFSGAMGLDLGLEAAGFEVRMAGDLDPAAVETIKVNRPHLPLFTGDVRELTGKDALGLAGLDRIDLLAGGPPCQAFSTAGRRLSVDCEKNGSLIFEFIRLLSEIQPRAFILENVKGLLSAPLKWRELPYNNNGKRIDDQYGALMRAVLAEITDIGYSSKAMLLNAADFGVPQSRERVFIVGFRDGSEPVGPEQTHSRFPNLLYKPWRTVGDAWKNLPTEVEACAKFSERKMHYLRMIPEGSNWRSLPVDLQMESMGRAFYAKGGRTGYWRRLSRFETAPTVLTEPQNASTSLCHPTEDRPISVREAARLQTFPDDWKFVGKTSAQYRQIGNAVPVMLAQAIATSVARKLLKCVVD
nr:DNA cytosine methyltransferase [Magnetospirillum aberrantis]